MRYWLTTHWPNRTDVPADAPHYGIWLPDGKIEAANGMQRGDLVLVYETKGGKTTVERYADGSIKKIPRHDGRQGIVGLMTVLDRPSQPVDSKPEAYSDGTSTWWRYTAPTTSLNSTGFVARERVLQVLGLSHAYYFKGYGKLNSGLGEIPVEQFEQLRALLEASTTTHTSIIADRLAAVPSIGGTGEGAIHKALKLAVAADPSRVLGEDGLRLWKLEYVLPTGDRIDVVLTDRFGRFVVVEIEPYCAADEIVGPMQCIKYRALMAFAYDHPLAEVRALLVAPAIHADVQSRCAKHSVVCVQTSADHGPSASAV